MASFYDNASIITIPSGYKAGTLYSAKPTDGTGDMAFTRTGDTATRVNSAGLIERCITNVALQSNVFSNASWTKTNVTIAGSIADPNGGITAFSMAGTSSTSNIKNITQTVFSAGADAKSVSIYAKANTHSFIQIRLASTGGYVNFDLTNGTFSAGGGATGTMTSLGSGWYRIVIFQVTTGTLATINLVDSLTAIINEASTTTNSVYIWRAQAQTGDFATNYIDTTTAAVTEGPVTNLPRLDYFGSTCPQLLMEPTRTNLHTYSQMFDNSAWTKTNMSVSGNTTISLDGYQNADSLTPNTTNGQHYINKTIASVTSGTPYAISVFAKAKGYNYLFIYQATTANAYFNLSNGTIASVGAGATAKIENYGNGWYRCSIVVTPSIASLVCEFHALANTSNVVYSGDGTSGIYLWGAQLEAGPYATSYIPTTAATVTRNGDVCTKGGISSLIGSTEGTLFVDIFFDGAKVNNPTYIQTWFSQSERQGIFYSASANLIRPFVTSSALLDFGSLGITPTINTRYKLAYAYKANDYAFYVNGQSINIGTRTAVATAGTNLFIGCLENSTQPDRQGSDIYQALVFKTRLTNAELATLTTL